MSIDIWGPIICFVITAVSYAVYRYFSENVYLKYQK